MRCKYLGKGQHCTRRLEGLSRVFNVSQLSGASEAGIWNERPMMLSGVKVPGCLSNLDDDALAIVDVSSDPPQLIRYVRYGRVKTQRTKNVFLAPTRRLVWKTIVLLSIALQRRSFGMDDS